jgi:hypothetical protein
VRPSVSLRNSGRKERLRRGPDANDRRVEPHAAGRAVERGVAEREDPPVGGCFPIGEGVGIRVVPRTQANHGFVERKTRGGALVGGSTKGEDRSSDDRRTSVQSAGLAMTNVERRVNDRANLWLMGNFASMRIRTA